MSKVGQQCQTPVGEYYQLPATRNYRPSVITDQLVLNRTIYNGLVNLSLLGYDDKLNGRKGMNVDYIVMQEKLKVEIECGCCIQWVRDAEEPVLCR